MVFHMFNKIMIPVDLSHWDKLSRSLEVAQQMAQANNATLLLVGVEGNLPSQAAHNPQEFREKLAGKARETADRTGLTVDSLPVHSNDPAVELSSALVNAADAEAADLIVMASHVPGLMDHVFSAHGAYVARYAKASVLLVR